MKVEFDVCIIGGGLAGLSASLHLNKLGFSVVVVEKNSYPNHKVCGEYVSNEILPYLQWLGVDLDELPIAKIHNLKLSTKTGKYLETKLPLGGFGISRYAFDLMLYQKAKEQGVHFIRAVVTRVDFNQDQFGILMGQKGSIQAKHTIGAYGKRSNLDKWLGRSFIQQKSPWLGVKCHYQYPGFPEDLVALHHFDGGYGGLSKTEMGTVNFCYLATFKSFKKYRSIADYNAHVVGKNPFLGEFLSEAKPVFDAPLTISQISFQKKNAVENHMLMCGDSAGLIHPLCGNGMAMAIHSAKIASECILEHLQTHAAERRRLEATYQERWRDAFSGRLWMGRNLQRLLMHGGASDLLIGSVAKSEKILQSMIQTTHGKPILV
ncbi:FAD dependent oxidoreductase [Croceitalea dokdonensis DOKDO 023]|uniref:FAD dependent oxidoreductase n=1 Tax=Croceitalea dokdonensis DOKDO 023 TaxID=1300341 RepID=A0A0P7B418_9FLAO|nr:NAD(P)/FAD-dependent oxidoreductase [Croceitalea dokdonensis]KPM33393.1 FAD dependent oxidoreductase [Croceitalea dokdonensis DOKDO 023]